VKRISSFTNRLGAGALGTALALLSGAAAAAAETNRTLKPETLTVAYTKAAFLNVNRTDVEAGYIVLAQTVGRRRGYLVTSKVHVFDEASEFEGLLQDEATRLIIVDAWRYLGMDTSKITPFFVSSERGKVGKQYLLLSRQGSGLNTLADLRGKEIMVYEVANTTQGRAWLETLLLESRCGKPDEFFATAMSTGKPTAAVLPVFFGKKHACVVDRAAFELMKELNPQVGKAVQVLAESEPLVDSLVCLRNTGWGSGTFREDLIQTLAEFHREPAGAQILTIFKTDRLIPFEEAQLTTMRKLRATCDRLREEAKP
jgi:phosphonate transport system substrate-binding protein